MKTDDHGLQPCCCCGAEGARNILALDYKNAIPGTGWGCLKCGLAMDGASYIACDACRAARRPPREAFVGYSHNRKREPIEQVYARPKHAHDMTKHPESKHPDFGLIDAT